MYRHTDSHTVAAFLPAGYFGASLALLSLPYTGDWRPVLPNLSSRLRTIDPGPYAGHIVRASLAWLALLPAPCECTQLARCAHISAAASRARMRDTVRTTSSFFCCTSRCTRSKSVTSCSQAIPPGQTATCSRSATSTPSDPATSASQTPIFDLLHRRLAGNGPE